MLNCHFVPVFMGHEKSSLCFSVWVQNVPSPIHRGDLLRQLSYRTPQARFRPLWVQTLVQFRCGGKEAFLGTGSSTTTDFGLVLVLVLVLDQ